MKTIGLKRILSLLLALALTVSMLPASAVAAEAADGEPVVAGETGEESPAEGDASGSTAEPEEEPASDGTEDPTGDPADEAPSAADEVQALIDALPDADAITADNAADVAAQLAAIDEAEDALTDEEFATLDTSRYDAAVTALEALEGTEDPEPAEAETTGTLQSQINSAASGGTVTLTENVKEDITISESQNITLDLNGYTLTNASGDTISNKGTLTVKDSSTAKTGKVDNTTNGKGALVNYPDATATLNGGTFTRSEENGTSNTWYTIKNLGTMTITDGVTVTQAEGGNYSSLIDNGWYNASNPGTNDRSASSTDKTATLTINGGTFTGGINTVKNDDLGTLTINGGTFTNVTQCVVLNHNTATINGGTFDGSGIQAGTSTINGVVVNCGCDSSSDVGSLTINGGTFTGGASGSYVVYDKSTVDGAKTTITGGTFTAGSATMLATGDTASITVSGGAFSSKVDSTYLASGLVNREPGNNYYVVSSELATEKIDGTTYYLIDSAEDLFLFMYKVNMGTTAANGKLMADIDFTAYGNMVGKDKSKYSGTFDGNGYTVTVKYTTENVSFGKTVIGLFEAVTSGAVIKNLRVTGSITTTEGVTNAGGIVGKTTGSVTIQNCISEVDVTLAAVSGGTISCGGIVGVSTADELEVQNCAYTGTLTITGTGSTTVLCSGIVGNLSAPESNTVTFENCYANATYAHDDGQSVKIRTIGGVLTQDYDGSGKSTITNCYYVTNDSIPADDGSTTKRQGTSVTSEQVSSGALAYLLNGSTSGGTDWYQVLDSAAPADAAPVPAPFKRENSTVYAVAVGGVCVDLSNNTLAISVVASTDGGTTWKKYDSISAALEAVGTEEATIALTANVTESVTIEKDQNITLDLNGYTLTDDGGDTISNKGTLTVKDSSTAGTGKAGTGKVDNTTNGKGALVNYPDATATLNGGTFTRSKEDGSSNTWYTIKNLGTMRITDGVTVTQAEGGNYSSLIDNGWFDNKNPGTNDRNQSSTGKTATLTITGGTFTGGINTVKNDDLGTLNISGGTFTNVTQCVIMNHNIATISGGTFYGSDIKAGSNGEVHAVVYNHGCGAVGVDQGLLTITGGIFTGGEEGTYVIYDASINSDAKVDVDTSSGETTITDGAFGSSGGKATLLGSSGTATITVSGGKFTPTIEGDTYKDYLAEDCVIVDTDAGGQVVMKKTNYGYEIWNAAQLNAFATLVNDTGIEDGNESNAILMADIDFTESVYVTANMMIGSTEARAYAGTFDGNGHTITIAYNYGTKEKETGLYEGLFAYVGNGATIKSLRVRGSIYLDGKVTSAGGIAGKVSGAVTIQDCIAEVDITSNSTQEHKRGTYGGIVGEYFASNGTSGATVKNCRYKGTIDMANNKETGTLCSGIVGSVDTPNSTNITIDSCYADATYVNCENVRIRTIAGANFTDYGGKSVYENCCYVDNDIPDNKGVGDDSVQATRRQGKKVTLEQVASGEVAYYMNGTGNTGASGGTDWYQYLDCEAGALEVGTNADSYPVPQPFVSRDYTTIRVYATYACEHDTVNTSSAPVSYNNTEDYTTPHDVVVSWRWKTTGSGYNYDDESKEKGSVTATVSCSVCTGTLKADPTVTVTKTEDETTGTITYTATFTYNETTYEDTMTIAGTDDNSVKKYTLTLVNGQIEGTTDTSGRYSYGTKVAIEAVAPKNDDGDTDESKVFIGWYVGADGATGYEATQELLSTSAATSVYVESNMTLVARYEGAATKTEDYALVLTLSERQTVEKGTKVSMTIRWELSDGCTLVEAGILRGYDADEKLANYTVDSEGITKKTSSLSGTSGTYTNNLTMSATTAQKTLCVTGYIIYEDASGNKQTQYTTMQRSSPTTTNSMSS